MVKGIFTTKDTKNAKSLLNEVFHKEHKVSFYEIIQKKVLFYSCLLVSIRGRYFLFSSRRLWGRYLIRFSDKRNNDSFSANWKFTYHGFFSGYFFFTTKDLFQIFLFFSFYLCASVHFLNIVKKALSEHSEESLCG